MSDEYIVTLALQPDNPSNTKLVDEDGNTAYTITTTFDDKSVATTTICDETGKRVADWIWRDMNRSHLLAFKDRKREAASNWLQTSMIPFKTTARFVDDKGRQFKWKNNEPGLHLQLFSEDNKTRPIARFVPPQIDPKAPRGSPPVAPAKLLLDSLADEISDDVVVSFILLEAKKREKEIESGNRASSEVDRKSVV